MLGDGDASPVTQAGPRAQNQTAAVTSLGKNSTTEILFFR